MKIEIKHRFTGKILFEAEAGSLKLAVELAVQKNADLRGADLRGADLRGADLQGADLQGADLRGADLRGADLLGAYLRGADLLGAYLRGADLQGADLRGAYLRGADLQGEKLDKEPLQILGLRYFVLITREQMKIGCEFHKVSDWEKFTDVEILRMDGKEALLWWSSHKDILFALHKEHCKEAVE